MLHGHIDAVTSSGYVEGWAWDSNRPTRPLTVTVTVMASGGQDIAWGSAHRYRSDLAAARCGIGWCAFRLRLAVTVRDIRNTRLSLLECRSRDLLHCVDPVPFSEDGDVTLTSMTDVTNSDPTVLASIGQLHGCEDVFATFIKRHGVDGFVRTAYVYVLGRAADVSGRTQYGRLLRQGAMTPFSLLLTLSESDEFRSRPRLLSSPNRASFPFHAV